MRATGTISLFPVTENGYSLALKLKKKLAGVTVCKPGELRGGRLFRKVKEAFGASDALVFVCASGIAVRAVSPLLKGKHVDPAVIVMDEKGGFVISLLSGHLGGANRLAGKIASLIGATPVITTATDVMGLPCVEDIAERFSLSIEDVKKIKVVNSAIVKRTGAAGGAAVLVVDEDPARLAAVKKAFGKTPVFGFKKRLPDDLEGFRACVLITSLTGKKNAASGRIMALRPKEFVAGVGCKRGVRAGEVEEALNEALKKAGVSPLSVRNLATIDIKKDEKGLLLFAKRARLSVEFFSSSELNGIKRLPSGSSRVVMEKTGAGGVCEPAALLSSGAKRIWLKKIKTERVTVALARVPFT